ncbi:GDSL-type esterase/lipase family protein [uncultured Dialister sp.]|uniref:SGNH/GDSL hydrolase family protein n=1 Tax=uncultured Dialister sp. TaxID=278064 RepID=UPI00266EED2D|nr:GDSL-type esterase/lipase family protein [uncultured Dialister sp.]
MNQKIIISTVLAALLSAGTVSAEELLHLSWKPDYDAVKYDVTFSRRDQGKMEGTWKTIAYMSDMLLPESGQFKDLQGLYWQERPLDFDGYPIDAESGPRPLESSVTPVSRNAPLPRLDRSGERGGALLYPVYSYIGNPGASSYEIEVLSAYPENTEGTAHSMYRIGGGDFLYTDFYDDTPRFGTWYWRVRGKDEEGNPVGQWSLPQKRQFSTEGYTIGLFGDSITHGGGRMSYGPNDLEYSYGHYLDFDTINLGDSGNTSHDMVERFDRDVLPFHLKYLLILGGSNSLRGGVPAEEVIRDLQEIQQKCRDHGIVPILLTLPPINPSSIDKVFHEPTAEGWEEAFRKVNAFIRTQPHIDTAAAFLYDNLMPEYLALDGLHGDVEAKKRMADMINRHIGEFVK